MASSMWGGPPANNGAGVNQNPFGAPAPQQQNGGSNQFQQPSQQYNPFAAAPAPVQQQQQQQQQPYYPPPAAGAPAPNGAPPQPFGQPQQPMQQQQQNALVPTQQPTNPYAGMIQQHPQQQYQQQQQHQSNALVPTQQPTNQWGAMVPAPAPANAAAASFDPFYMPPPAPAPPPVPAPVPVQQAPPQQATSPMPPVREVIRDIDFNSVSGAVSVVSEHSHFVSGDASVSSKRAPASTTGTYASTDMVSRTEERPRTIEDTYAPSPRLDPRKTEYSQELARTAGPDASPLPRSDLVLHSGYIQSRISFRTILLKKWKQSYWIQYGPHTVMFFRNEADFDDWLNNPYHNFTEREFLVKLQVDFVSDLHKPNVRGYQTTQMTTKSYRRARMKQFKLERWMDYGPTIAAAFASPDNREVEALRDVIVSCMKNSPRDPTQFVPGTNRYGGSHEQFPHERIGGGERGGLQSGSRFSAAPSPTGGYLPNGYAGAAPSSARRSVPSSSASASGVLDESDAASQYSGAVSYQGDYYSPGAQQQPVRHAQSMSVVDDGIFYNTAASGQVNNGPMARQQFQQYR